MNRTQHLAFSGLTIWGADGTIQPRTTRRGGVGAPVGLTVFKTAGGSLGAVPGGFDSHTPLPYDVVPSAIVEFSGSLENIRMKCKASFSKLKNCNPAQVSHDLPLLLLFLLTGEPCYHGGQRLQALLEDTDIRDAIALPASQEIFADLIDGAKQQVWRLQDHVGTHIESRRQGGRDSM